MTEVDFYILGANTQSEEKLAFTCRLVEKIYRLDRKVHIHTTSPSESARLDDLLWTYRDSTFLPHGIVGHTATAQSPISIGHSEDFGKINDVLINLTDEVPSFFSQFLRLSELVSGDESAKSAARKRFSFYKTRGYPLKTHNLENDG